MISNKELTKIGRFTKPHGIKGEIGLATTYDIFTHDNNPVLLCETEGILVPFFVEAYRHKTGTVLLVKLETVDSDETARKFSYCDVYYPLPTPKEEAPGSMPAGWPAYTGYTVSDKEYGLLGKITDVDETTANTLLRIESQEKEQLIPGVEEWIIAANHETKHLQVTLPKGLLEL